MHIWEIVLSEHLLDIGLCIGQDENLIPIIHPMNSKYSDSDSRYGGVQYVKWLETGVYTTLKDWNEKTNSHMSVLEVMNMFSISRYNLVPTPCKIISDCENGKCIGNTFELSIKGKNGTDFAVISREQYIQIMEIIGIAISNDEL